MEGSELAYKRNLRESLRELRLADHILYITYPIVKDKRLLLSSIDRLYDSLKKIINALLQYDYLNKKIIIYEDSKMNFETFKCKVAQKYGISSQDLIKIEEFLALVQNHKKSPMEFLRKEKVVIMSQDLKTTTITPEIVKDYLFFIKNLFRKAQIILA